MSWDVIDSSSGLFMKSTLFGFNKKSRGVFLKDEKVLEDSELEAYYTGEYLTQFDRDISLAMKRLAVNNTVDGVNFYFSIHDYLRLLRKKNYGKKDKVLIHQSIMRAANARYCLAKNGDSFEGKSVQNMIYNDETGRYHAAVNEDWVDFFNGSASYKYNLSQRLLLSTGLSRWLHGMLSTSTAPQIFHVEELWLLSGSGEKVIGNFKKNLSRSLNELIMIKFLSIGKILHNGDVILRRI